MTHAPTPTVLEIWTDGACKKNPGVGGWGAWLVWGKYTLELYGGSALTTNNQMELTAVIRALGLVPSSFILTAATLKTALHGGFTGGKKTAGAPLTKSPSKTANFGRNLIDWSVSIRLTGVG